MKRLFATFVSCLALLSATVTTPALAEVKDEAEQSSVSVFQDALTTATDGIQSIIDGVRTNIAELFDASDHLVLEESESAQASELGASQDAESFAVIPSNIDGVVWDTGYTTCTLQSGYSVDGQALQAEIESHQFSLTTFVAENNTSLTGSAANLFFDCRALSTVDLASSFSTGAVTDMTYMFSGCSALTSLTLPDVSVIQDHASVNNMFAVQDPTTGAFALRSLTLPKGFKMKEGTGLPGLASQGSSKYYWTTSIDSCVNYGQLRMRPLLTLIMSWLQVLIL